MRSIAKTLALLLVIAAAATSLTTLAEHTSDGIILEKDFFRDDAYKSGNQGKDNFYVRIDTAKHRVSVYQRRGGEWTLLGTKKCASGTDDTPTPKGQFQVLKKQETFIANDANWNYVTYFFEDYAIHSTGEMGGKYNNKPLGKNVSHGCVRLKPEDAKWIYGHIPIGTRVDII